MVLWLRSRVLPSGFRLDSGFWRIPEQINLALEWFNSGVCSAEPKVIRGNLRIPKNEASQELKKKQNAQPSKRGGKGTRGRFVRNAVLWRRQRRKQKKIRLQALMTMVARRGKTPAAAAAVIVTAATVTAMGAVTLTRVIIMVMEVGGVEETKRSGQIIKINNYSMSLSSSLLSPLLSSTPLS